VRSYAKNISSTAKITTIAADMTENDLTLAEKTIGGCLNALIRIHLIEDVPAWNLALRSRTALTATPKRHFTDPSIAVVMLASNHKPLLKDFKTFGLLFESLVVRDLRIYSQALGVELFHYRDKNGLEADGVSI
jgi:predicted AAA+ superfamily ATPase